MEWFGNVLLFFANEVQSVLWKNEFSLFNSASVL